MRFTKLGTGCPICGGQRRGHRRGGGECKQNSDGLIFCITGKELSTLPPGWRQVGEDKHGTYGLFSDSAQGISDEQREELRRQRAAKRKRLEAEESRRRQDALTSQERDKEIRKLLSQLSLDERDRKDLKRRGLSDEQIKAGQFVSIEPWQRLEFPISPRLAGVDITGQSLCNPQAGYICPIRNAAGLITGWQLRLRESDDGGKYRWPSSQTRRRPKGPTSHQKNGELPITVCLPSGDVKGKLPGFAEGVLKPWIAAQQGNIPVIGAAGGQWTSSPESLRSAVEAVAIQTGSNKFLLYPDGGAFKNKNVMRQYDALHTMLSNWDYKLEVAWYGQTTKDDPDIDELLAAGNGHLIREITWEDFKAIADEQSTESQPERDKIIPHEQWEAKYKLPQEFKALSERIKQQFNRISRKFSQGNGELQKAPQPNPKNATTAEECTAITLYDRRNDGRLTLDYVPGELPTKEEWIAKGLPTIVFKQGHRALLIAEGFEKGHDRILDNSVVGQGKSTDSGRKLAEAIGITPDSKERLFNLASNHRNPTTPEVEEFFTDLPARHNGLISDESKLTALGNPYIRNPQKNETPNIPGNCPETDTFRLIENQGRIVHGGKDSPICENCPRFQGCEFLTARRETLAGQYIRAHLDQMPKPGQGDFGFIDEAGTSLKPTKTYEVTADKLQDVAHKLRLIDSQLEALLWPFISILIQAVTEEKGKHGINHNQILAKMPSITEILWNHDQDEWLKSDDPWTIPNLREIKQKVDELLKPNLQSLLEGRNTPEEKQRAIANNLTFNWLSHLLDALDGKKKISLQIKGGVLKITVPNYRHRSIIKGFEGVVFADATLSTHDLTKNIGINSDECLAIKQETPDFSNLTINFVSGLGRCGQQREHFNSDGEIEQSIYSLQNRLNVLIDAINAKYSPEAKGGFLEKKSCLHHNEKKFAVAGYNFNDNRGSNKFKDCDYLTIAGNLAPNLGQMAAEWQAMTGKPVSPAILTGSYGAWVKRQIEAEMIQAVGRLRAHLRPDKKLDVWLLSDWDDSLKTRLLEYFKGATIKTVEAYDLTPAAAKKGEQTQRGIVAAVWSAVQSGVKTSIDEIAATVEVSKGRVSQICSPFGGFKKLKKSLVLLLEAINSKTKLSNLPSDALWVAEQFLPEIVKQLELGAVTPAEVVEEFVGLAEAFCYKAFQAILAATPAWVLTKIFGTVLRLLPDECKDDLRELGIEIAKLLSAAK